MISPLAGLLVSESHSIRLQPLELIDKWGSRWSSQRLKKFQVSTRRILKRYGPSMVLRASTTFSPPRPKTYNQKSDWETLPFLDAEVPEDLPCIQHGGGFIQCEYIWEPGVWSGLPAKLGRGRNRILDSDLYLLSYIPQVLLRGVEDSTLKI